MLLVWACCNDSHWKKFFTHCRYFFWGSLVIQETDVTGQHFTESEQESLYVPLNWKYTEVGGQLVKQSEKNLENCYEVLLILSQAQVSCLREFLAPQAMPCLLRGVCLTLNTLIGWCFLRKIRNRKKYQKLFTHSSLTQHLSQNASTHR